LCLFPLAPQLDILPTDFAGLSPTAHPAHILATACYSHIIQCSSSLQISIKNYYRLGSKSALEKALACAEVLVSSPAGGAKHPISQG
jgi:hypothetical protein